MDNSKSAHETDSGELLEYIEVNTSDIPEYSVIWMHGLGADGHDFEPIVPYLGLPPGAAVRFIFPHALMRPITINGGAVMRAWYDIIEISINRGQDEAGIKHSAGKIRDLIDHEIKRGIPASKIVLAGFSQGGAIASHCALRFTEALAGLMALSTYLPLRSTVQVEIADSPTAQPKSLRIFMAHGRSDPMLPMHLGTSSRDAVEELGYSVEWFDYPMPHAVCPQEIADISTWLVACFA